MAVQRLCWVLSPQPHVARLDICVDTRFLRIETQKPRQRRAHSRLWRFWPGLPPPPRLELRLRRAQRYFHISFVSLPSHVKVKPTQGETVNFLVFLSFRGAVSFSPHASHQKSTRKERGEKSEKERRELLKSLDFFRSAWKRSPNSRVGAVW